jgi:anti-anti-sigma factor
VLDLSETQFIDSEGSSAILKGLLQAKQQQVKFALRGVHPQLKMILELGGVLKFFREK